MQSIKTCDDFSSCMAHKLNQLCNMVLYRLAVVVPDNRRKRTAAFVDILQKRNY